MNPDKLRKLRPFFRPQGGTITGARAATRALPCGRCHWWVLATACRATPERLL